MSSELVDDVMCICGHPSSIHNDADVCLFGWTWNKEENAWFQDEATPGCACLQFEFSKDESKNRNDICRFCGFQGNDDLIWVTESGKVVKSDDPLAAERECRDFTECWNRRLVNEHSARWGQSGGSSNLRSVQKCRHEPTAVFTLGDLAFYGASQSKLEDGDFDLKNTEVCVVSLLGSTRKDGPVWSRFKEWIPKLNPPTVPPHVIVDWTDYSAPPVGAGFWNTLVSLCNKKGFKHVVFYCVGGHGRTGTALSSVLIECANVEAEKAVEFVRQKYCKEAVESKSQATYLENLEKFWKSQKKEKRTKK